MSFLEEYKQKLVSADEAVKLSNQATGLTTAGAQAHLMPSTRHLPEELMNLRMSMYVVVFCLSHLPFRA